MNRIALAAASLAALSLTACTDETGARKALEAQGYKDIIITGHRYFGCGEHDSYRTGFRAIGVNGAPISGVVCRGAGMFPKGSTVRLD